MQAIYDIAEICKRKNIRHAVLSPGSRCAPLTVAFARQETIQKFSIPDERSAAFIGLGLSRITQLPTVLVCTSGSAAYNYAPAVAEAYFQHIPLLLLTADRPPEWIDQLDGQTIRQQNIFGQHVKASYTLPLDDSHPDTCWHIHRMVNEAINVANSFPKGPVHINVPLREPFYPTGDIHFSNNLKIIDQLQANKIMADEAWEKLLARLTNKKVLVVAGQYWKDESLRATLEFLSCPIVVDCISNLGSEKTIRHQDIIFSSLSQTEEIDLVPEVLITFGNSIISKSLKLFLRKNKIAEHWHVQEDGYIADTFQSLTAHVPVSPRYFFKKLVSYSFPVSYKQSWNLQEEKALAKKKYFFTKENIFSELEAVQLLLDKIPNHSLVHLANSMPVRYVNTLGGVNPTIEVVANRGTSGIDGVISTSVGTALATDTLVVVVTGDMSFLYDRNAFWHNHLPANLRIVVLNNHGGGIFRMIDGPSKLPEGEEYFVTHQTWSVENSIRDTSILYQKANSKEAFQKLLQDFFALSTSSKVLEVETDGKHNTVVWKKFKESLLQKY